MGGYGVRLAAVEVAGVEEFRTRGVPLECSQSFQCSPLVARWVELEPLGSLLAHAIDGGELLKDGLWNETRPPMSHLPADVRTLAKDLGRAWMEAEQTPIACDDFFIGEIKRVVQLFVHAASHDQVVISAVLPVLTGPGGDEVRLFVGD